MGNKSRCIHAEIVPKKGEPIERIIKRFKKKVRKSGIMQTLKKYRYYEKPSIGKRKRKKQKELAIKKFDEMQLKRSK